MTLQQIIEQLLRSRLYRLGVVLEMDSGETSEGLVSDLVYDGSRSAVVVTEPGLPKRTRTLPLASITRVDVRRGPADAA